MMIDTIKRYPYRVHYRKQPGYPIERVDMAATSATNARERFAEEIAAGDPYVLERVTRRRGWINEG